MYLVLGFVGYVAVLLGLFGVAQVGAQLAARALGVGPFRWFDGRVAEAAGWQRGVVRAASSLAPVVAAIALLFVALLWRGESIATTRIQVLAGAAKAAGLQDGDRILSVDSTPVATFDAIRAEVSRGAGEKKIELERGQEKLVIPVTPVDGRIGVAPAYEERPIGAAQALEQALGTPVQIASSYLKAAAGNERTELAGPVAIVRQVDTRRDRGSILHFLALIAITLCPGAAGLHVFDALTLALFRVTHPWSEGTAAEAASARLARIRQTLWVSLICVSLLVVLSAIHETSFGDGALVGIFLLAPGGYAAILLVGLANWLRFGRSAGLGTVLVSAFIPCAVVLVAVWVLKWLRAELTRRNFELRGLVAQPMSPG